MSFYVTTPIYYVNDVPHVGHAYTSIATDALVRYHRARGQAARMLTGTDEHGQKIAETAAAKGVTPIEHADRVVQRFIETWKHLEISNDDYIRTTEARHKQVVQDFWKRLEAAGDIYLSEYEGLYCVSCEAFYTEGQLEQPGNLCPDHKKPVTTVKEASYFFRMAKYQDRLIEHFEKHPEFVQPESRRNEILSFIRSGLRDLSISRTSFDWGIPVPGNDKHVIYVWVDALTNYVSALGGVGAPLYQEYWAGGDGAKRVHVIGKDILRFHAVYWPTMLMAAGLPLPTTIFAHGWWTVRGQKIAKSMPATRVDPNLIASDVGPDALRYFLLREIPLGVDGDFSFEGLISRFNSDLANDLGNLLNRTLSMLQKYVGGVVPEPVPALDGQAPHAGLKELAEKAKTEAERHFDAIAPSRALEAIWELVRGANAYVATAEPWTLAKDPAKKAELGHVLHTFLEACVWAALLAAPVIPGKAGEILTQLGAPQLAGTWPTTWNTMLPPGTKILTPQPIFPRIDEARAKELLDRWIPPEARQDGVPAPVDEQATAKGGKTAPATAAAAPAPAAKKPKDDALAPGQISYDDFSKLDLRVGHVVAAERVPKKDKLLKLQVDVGEGQTRQVVAGIAETYAPEALLGKRVIFLANLKPAKIGGVESQGMILAAGEEKVVALSALDQDVPPGTKVR